MKLVPARNRKIANGTCLQGYVEATYAQLVKAFGQPIPGSGDGKVRAEWVLTIQGENVPVTIYDYKDTRPLKSLTEWHVGGNSKLALHALDAAGFTVHWM